MIVATASRAPYIAQTPDVATFSSDIPLARFDATELDVALACPAILYQNSFQGRLQRKWRRLASGCKTTYKGNIGLLLIAASTAFGSMMSTLVKKLNSVDPPVPMLEVSLYKSTCSP